MARAYQIGAVAALGLGLAAGCFSVGGRDHADRPAPEPAAEAAAAGDLTPEESRRIKNVFKARDRLTWVNIEDQGHILRGIYDDGRDQWVQFFHSPTCPCHAKREARPGAWAAAD